MVKKIALLLCFIFTCSHISEQDKPDPFNHPKEDQAGTIKAVTFKSPSYHYYLHLPPDYETENNLYPLLLFLHGSGERGNILTPRVLVNGPLKPLYLRINNTDAIEESALADINPYVKGAYVVVPMAPTGGWWEPGEIDKIITQMISLYPIDEKRIYLTGLSMGGGGTWVYTKSYPHRVAAIIPICGAASGASSFSALHNIPIWAFHSFDDATVNPITTTNVILEKILSIDNILSGYPHENGDPGNPAPDDYSVYYSFEGTGGNWKKGILFPNGPVSYTLYPDGGHDSWTRTYDNPEVWQWLFRQQKSSDKNDS